MALLHLVQQAGCGLAWRRLVEPPRPSAYAFFRARWIRAAVAALVPISGVGAALVAVRVAMHAGLRMDIASASLLFDATMEMLTQILFTALGFALLFLTSPQPGVAEWAAGTLSLAGLAVAAFIAVQRGGGLKLVEAGLVRLADRWPRLASLKEARLHGHLLQLHQQRRAALVAGSLHLACWLLAAGEIWLVLRALGHPISPAKCIILESLSMAARSTGFLIPSGLGVQEIALVAVGRLIGLPSELALLVAVAKRLRDVVVGVPGLVLWHWGEDRRLRLTPSPANLPDAAEG